MLSLVLASLSPHRWRQLSNRHLHPRAHFPQTAGRLTITRILAQH
jgi:hypothetical protein